MRYLTSASNRGATYEVGFQNSLVLQVRRY